MASRLITLLIAVLVIGGVAAPVTAQSPMPYAEYRAELDAAREAETRISESETATGTVDDVLTRLTAALGRWDAQATRLEAITPTRATPMPTPNTRRTPGMWSTPTATPCR